MRIENKDKQHIRKPNSSPRHKSRRLLVLISALIVAAIVTYTLLAHSYNLLPLSLDVGKNSRSTEVPTETPADPEAEQGKTENNQTDNPRYETIAPVEIEGPSDQAPFPIENAHYRIEQTDNDQFNVTIFALINSPSQYSDYTNQLRQYKSEVTEYLQKRFPGHSLNITWNPEDARNI